MSENAITVLMDMKRGYQHKGVELCNNEILEQLTKVYWPYVAGMDTIDARNMLINLAPNSNVSYTKEGGLSWSLNPKDIISFIQVHYVPKEEQND